MIAVLPVIARELRDESRQWSTYWLRVLVVAGLLLALLPAAYLTFGSLAQTGRLVFERMHSLIFAGIWVLVPLLAADCISREKREGTLGLLFLTPLTGGGVLGAKGFVHGLRGSTLLLASVPGMALPLLLGGVAWADVVWAFLINTAALLYALFAGLLASSLARRWSRATLLAALLSFCLLNAFLVLHGRLAWGTAPATFGEGWRMAVSLDAMPARITTAGPGGIAVTTWFRAAPAPIPKARKLIAAFQMTATGTAGGLLLWLFAGAQLRKAVLDTGPGPRQKAIEKRFCTPVLRKDAFRAHLRRALDRNPIGWLAQYSWSSRVARWGWCLAALLFEIITFNNHSYHSYTLAPPWFFAAFIGGIALSAANSFSREKESGALELLLVTPLQERQIVLGRLSGLLSLTLPGVVFYCILYEAFHTARNIHLWVVLMLVNTVCISAIGLYFSLFSWNLLLRWLATIVLAVILPLFALRFLVLHGAGLADHVILLLFLQTVIALACYHRARRRLRSCACALV